MSRAMALLVALLGVAGAVATPYWIDWEGTNWPENQHWLRSWGNWNGPHEGGAHRTLDNGILTYDSLYDPGVYDYNYMERPGQMDPGPSEQLVLEWSIKVDALNGYAEYDPAVAFSSDERWCLGFGYAVDHILCLAENNLSIPFAPGVWHTYRVVSTNVRTYDLYIDCELAHQGVFMQLASSSYIGWGDSVQGAGSLHHWDYFRYGVVPEPISIALVSVILACYRFKPR